MSLAVAEPSVALEQVRTGNVMHFAMTPAEAKGWADSVREMKVAVLRDGSDYMVIPGTPKPSLLKPGAEMLLLAAGLGFSLTKIVDPSDVDRGGVTYRCTVHRGSKDNVVSECDGYAGYDEDRFYRSAAVNEASERYWAEKNRRPVNPLKCVEYKAPWNSVVKMAIKRALVGATLNACAASGLFTQDLEDERKSTVVPWDATVVVKPYTDALTGEQSTELRKWWKTADSGRPLPGLAHLSAEQGALVLFQVGGLTVTQVRPPEAPPTETRTAPEPPSAAQTPEPASVAPAASETVTQAPVVDDAEQARVATERLTAELASTGTHGLWQPADGPKLPAGITDQDLITDRSTDEALNARTDDAWDRYPEVMQERLDWLSAKMGIGPGGAK